MNDQEKKEYIEYLSNREKKIEDHKDLAKFVDELLYAYSEECFEEQDVEEYLIGMSHLLDALDAWIKNTNWGEGAPEQPDWSLMARLLMSSFYHS